MATIPNIPIILSDIIQRSKISGSDYNEAVSFSKSAKSLEDLYSLSRYNSIVSTATTYGSDAIIKSISTAKNKATYEVIENKNNLSTITTDMFLNLSPDKLLGIRYYYTEKVTITNEDRKTDINKVILTGDVNNKILTRETYIINETNENYSERITIEKFYKGSNGQYLWEVHEKYFSNTTALTNDIIYTLIPDKTINPTYTVKISLETNNKVNDSITKIYQDIILTKNSLYISESRDANELESETIIDKNKLYQKVTDDYFIRMTRNSLVHEDENFFLYNSTFDYDRTKFTYVSYWLNTKTLEINDKPKEKLKEMPISLTKDNDNPLVSLLKANSIMIMKYNNNLPRDAEIFVIEV